MNDWEETRTKKEGEFYSFGKCFLFESTPVQNPHEPRLLRPFDEGYYMGENGPDHKLLGRLKAGSTQRDFYFYTPKNPTQSTETKKLAEAYSDAT